MHDSVNPWAEWRPSWEKYACTNITYRSYIYGTYIGFTSRVCIYYYTVDVSVYTRPHTHACVHSQFSRVFECAYACVCCRRSIERKQQRSSVAHSCVIYYYYERKQKNVVVVAAWLGQYNIVRCFIYVVRYSAGENRGDRCVLKSSSWCCTDRYNDRDRLYWFYIKSFVKKKLSSLVIINPKRVCRIVNRYNMIILRVYGQGWTC